MASTAYFVFPQCLQMGHYFCLNAKMHLNRGRSAWLEKVSLATNTILILLNRFSVNKDVIYSCTNCGRNDKSKEGMWVMLNIIDIY